MATAAARSRTEIPGAPCSVAWRGGHVVTHLDGTDTPWAAPTAKAPWRMRAPPADRSSGCAAAPGHRSAYPSPRREPTDEQAPNKRPTPRDDRTPSRALRGSGRDHRARALRPPKSPRAGATPGHLATPATARLHRSRPARPPRLPAPRAHDARRRTTRAGLVREGDRRSCRLLAACAVRQGLPSRARSSAPKFVGDAPVSCRPPSGVPRTGFRANVSRRATVRSWRRWRRVVTHKQARPPRSVPVYRMFTGPSTGRVLREPVVVMTPARSACCKEVSVRG